MKKTIVIHGKDGEKEQKGLRCGRRKVCRIFFTFQWYMFTLWT